METIIIDEFALDKEYLESFGLDLIGIKMVNNEKIYLVRKKKYSLTDK